MRPTGMSCYLLLSALAHLVLVPVLYLFAVPPQGEPFSPAEQLISVTWLQSQAAPDAAPPEMAAETLTPGQEAGDVPSTILPDQPMQLDSQTGAVPESPLTHEGGLLKAPDPRPPSPKLPPSARRRPHTRASQAERSGDSPPSLPQQIEPQPRQVRQNTDGTRGEPSAAVEPTLPALPGSAKRHGLPTGGPSPLPGLAQDRPLGRLPLLHESDLHKYAQLPSPQQPGRKARPPAGVDTSISLNTGDLTYLAYFAHIKQKIERVWDYPAEAMNRKVEGQLLLPFVPQRSGQVKGVEFLRPSGFEVLDRHAWDAVVKSDPFDPIPSHIPQTSFASGRASLTS